MAIYRVDMKLCGTLYVRANNKKAAMKLAEAQKDQWIEVQGEDVSNLRFDDPNLPDVSWSGAMTCYGPWEGVEPERADDD